MDIALIKYVQSPKIISRYGEIISRYSDLAKLLLRPSYTTFARWLNLVNLIGHYSEIISRYIDLVKSLWYHALVAY